MPWNEFINSDVWVRFIIYGLLGYLFEVFFTATMDFVWPKFLSSWNVHQDGEPTTVVPQWRKLRDNRLVGYSFIWMFPIYGLIVLMEPLSFYFKQFGIPIFFRAMIYGLLITVAEYLTGKILILITGKCPWDYRYSKLSIGGTTRWDFYLVWFLVSFALEKFLPVWIELTPHILAAFSKI